MKNLIIITIFLLACIAIVQGVYTYQTTNANSLQNIIASNFYN